MYVLLYAVFPLVSIMYNSELTAIVSSFILDKDTQYMSVLYNISVG